MTEPKSAKPTMKPTALVTENVWLRKRESGMSGSWVLRACHHTKSAPITSPASSAFFTLTGFHGVHVTIGIIMLLSVTGLSLRNNLGQERAEAVEIVGLYWHFVDVVCILIFTVVYLIK